MDEALSTTSIDISGRPYLVYHAAGVKDKIGDFDTELVEEFFQGFVNHAQVTLHINLAYGKNSHHMIESIFKGLDRKSTRLNSSHVSISYAVFCLNTNTA